MRYYSRLWGYWRARVSEQNAPSAADGVVERAHRQLGERRQLLATTHGRRGDCGVVLSGDFCGESPGRRLSLLGGRGDFGGFARELRRLRGLSLLLAHSACALYLPWPSITAKQPCFRALGDPSAGNMDANAPLARAR